MTIPVLDPTRRPGLSVRLRLTLSYAGFLAFAGVLLAGAALLLLEIAVPLAAGVVVFLTLVGLAGGWVLAGRMLRPLVEISEAARLAGLGSLSHRVRLAGPDDEFRRLADVFDQMLARLERSFEEQRRFTANASHELRTPHAVMKTMLQVARADPEGRDADAVLARLAEMNDRSIGTLEALLHLSRADRDQIRRYRCDLADVVDDAVQVALEDDDAGGVRLDVVTEPAVVVGDGGLLAQLAGNLVRNAIVHNVPEGGTVRVRTGVDERARAVLSVENTGEVVAPDLAARLTEPFVRGQGRTRDGRGRSGSGLGLAIVASVAKAHRAQLSVLPRPGGGLVVLVRFPSPIGAPLSS